MARDIDRLHEEIEELFADLWQVPRFAGTRRGFRPNVDSFHTDEPHELTVVVELPGVDPDSLELVVGERILVISGERHRPKVGGCVSYQQMEIEYGPFRRQVRLAENVDPDRALARYEHGVVTIVLPVVEQPAPRGRVTIEVAQG
ncbi:MAG TPA: Hsp20/alpha crystallin family protein [Gaiellaceae bacterium]|nr:Hsp20/alpha crystallin family protein [Gaiellaceae bacterium]